MTLVKTPTLDKAQVKALLSGIFEQFQEFGNQQETPNINDLGKYFANNLQFLCNGKPTCKNLTDFLHRTTNILKQYPSYSFSRLFDELLIPDNKVVIRYDCDLVARNNQKSQINIMAILTIENNKVTQWSEVVHEKGAGGYWDP